MKNTILAILLLGLASCNNAYQNQPPQKTYVISPTKVTDEFLMEEVHHGLHMITVNDTTKVLIYRGVESVSMIQLK
jgi:hypothetical protein